jgi:hypothetical protein
MTAGEQRKFTRVRFETTVRITTRDRVLVSQSLRNVSLGGVYVRVVDQLPLGTSCGLAIELKGPGSLLSIQAEGEVVRVDPDEGMALQFTSIDLDGLIHLRHLIRIYAEDPEVVDLEFRGTLLGREPSS